jgi:carbon-monoxide dehydrogenase large subunit
VNPDTAELRVNPDGSLSLFAGTTSMGQGNETAFTQIVSDRLGVPPERIQVFWGDSDLLGAGRGNGGSGALTVGGSAVLRATEKVVERGRRIAAQVLRGRAGGRRPSATAASSVTGTDKGVAFAQVAKTAYQPRAAPHAGMEPGYSETAAFTPPAVTFPNGSQVCEVETTPRPAPSRSSATAWSTTGKMVNPLLVKGRSTAESCRGWDRGSSRT